MRYFMRNHAGQFAFVACRRNRARVDEQKSAWQGEGVYLARRDDSKLIGESFAGGFRRQLRAELFDVTVDLLVVEHRRLGQNLLGRLPADLDILPRAEKIEAGFETWLRMRTRRRLHSALPPAAIQLPDEQRNRQQRQCRSASDHIPGLLESAWGAGNREWGVGNNAFFPLPIPYSPLPVLLTALQTSAKPN